MNSPTIYEFEECVVQTCSSPRLIPRGWHYVVDLAEEGVLIQLGHWQVSTARSEWLRIQAEGRVRKSAA